MFHRRLVTSMLIGSLSCTPFMVGCENLPGDEKTQGAVIGGVGGALAGTAIGGKDNRLLGALIGGAAGAGGGYLIGANWDKITGKKKEDAQHANDRAERQPARAEDVEKATTADLNDDGFVTLDEVVAMEKAGLNDSEMIRRLERTGQYFELTRDQEDYLRKHDVSDKVVMAMRDIRPDDARRASDVHSGSNSTRDRSSSSRTDRDSNTTIRDSDRIDSNDRITDQTDRTSRDNRTDRISD